MIAWDLIEGFDWDKGNERKSFEKHGVSQGEAEQAFFNEPLLIVTDENTAKLKFGFMPSGIRMTEDAFTSLSRFG